MNIPRMRSKSGSFLSKLLLAATCVWLLGVVFTPALAAVAVDQQPLIIQKPLPPNITLMLDDSGSMAWDFMPDAAYLSGAYTSTIRYYYGGSYVGYSTGYLAPLDVLRNSAANGTYFDPNVTYAPPLKADGSRYTNSPGLANAYIDGFRNQTVANRVDITQYTSQSLCDYNARYDQYGRLLDCESAVTNFFPYYTAVQYSTTSTYAPTSTSTYSCANNYTLKSDGICHKDSDYSKTKNPVVTTVLSCNSGDALDSNNQCSKTTSASKNFFTYATGAAGGPYTQHYVGKTGDCAALSSSLQAVCDDGSPAQQNVANWFSYYRTRMLMAKSGLMNSFSAVDSTFRVGFGSINGNNSGGLPAATSTYNGKTIANAQVFGNGSSGTQKSSFWSWLVDETPNNGTPLRASLDAIGQYYQSSQPWQTSSGDSTELACRQSYAILTTDGFWNGSLSNGPGNADNPATHPTISGPNGQSYTYNPASPYADGNSNTLADVAMKYWITDLRGTGADNEVPTSTEDPAFWQHMTTFTLGLGFTPSGISPSGTTINQIFKWANGGAAISNFSWPTPSSDSINNIADLAHAAVNGHGGFYSATSPDAFASGLKDALKRASERVGTGASLAANSTQLKTGTVAYQANYYTAKWKGDLKALAVDPNTGAIAQTPTWSAATLPAFFNRKVWTYNPSVTPIAKVAFSVPGTLSTAEKAALGSSATDQQAMINYLLGDSSKEQKNTGGTFRNRDTALGDIVDSQPVYVGVPDPNQFNGETFTGSSDFAAFTVAKNARDPLLFVAANDGMLHAFDAGTGAETYAYLPAAVLSLGTSPTSGLATLSSPDYGATTAVPHQYFNDGELTVADVYFSSAWHTVAVGTTGRGTAKAIYALDVTSASTPTLLWERSAADGNADGNSDYIGEMTGKPVIAQTADGVWSVLIGNGYNSTNGTAALLQFAVSDGSLTVHATDSTADNGLAAPAVWIGDLTNGISTAAYAGDLHGGVWSFVLNDGSAGTPSSAGTKLFVAKDASNNVQPITAGMLAGKDPATGNLWLYFGTGQYLGAADLLTRDPESWYGLIVDSSTSGLAITAAKTRATSLVQRSIVAETAGAAAVAANPNATPPVAATAAILPARAVGAATAGDMSGKSGWYMDLLSPATTTAADGTVTTTNNALAEGERIVTPNQFQGSLLLATTRIPQAVDICNPSGRGWIMAIDPFTGASPSSSFFDLNGDGQINSPADTVTVGDKTYPAAGIGFSSLPNNPIFVGSTMLVSFDNGTASSVHTAGSGGPPKRVSWRELISQ